MLGDVVSNAFMEAPWPIKVATVITCTPLALGILLYRAIRR